MTIKKDDFLATNMKNSKVFIGTRDASLETADFINRYANRDRRKTPDNMIVVNGEPVVIDDDYVVLDV